MKLYTLDIPDDPAQLPDWLEGYLVGTELAAVVAELATVHGRDARRPVPLDPIIVNRLDAVRGQGLSALSTESLRWLLVHPLSLVELQADVLERGGSYWDQLSAKLGMHTPALQNTSRVVLNTSVSTMRSTWQGRAYQVVAWLATAACVLLAVSLWQSKKSSAVVATASWGWNKADAMAPKTEPREYLNQLADGAQEWFKKRPDNSADLAQRILQFRQGCSKLILAEHSSLPAEDKRWLVERCRAWVQQLDAQVVLLEAGEPVDKVRAQTDNTVDKLIKALRNPPSAKASKEA